MASAPSMKRVMIDKNNARIVVFVGVAAFIVVFSLIATKTLLSQATYQNRVISAKREAVSQLKSNITSADTLKTHYSAFIGTTQNVVGGNPTGSDSKDGNNAKIILDALPSSYDFPGLTTSLEALLANRNVTINSISGTDDEIAQSSNQSSVTPQAVPIPFQIAVSGDYSSIQGVISAFEKSIRPIQIITLDLSGSNNNITLSITAKTYYQPAKSLTINKKVVT